MKQLSNIEFELVENKRKEFVERFSVENIKKMDFDDYILGKGKENKSFCYLLEYGLRELGDIRFPTSIKYRIYWSKKKNDFIILPIYNNNKNLALNDVKHLLIELIENGAKNDKKSLKILKEIPFYPTVKGKILYVYYPNKYLPIYSKKDLYLFIDSLKINKNLNGLDEFDLRNILLEYKNIDEKYKNMTMLQFASLLYVKYKNK